MKDMKDYLNWTFASMGAGIAIMITANSMFQTKSEAKDRLDSLESVVEIKMDGLRKDIIRLEQKIDALTKRK